MMNNFLLYTTETSTIIISLGTLSWLQQRSRINQIYRWIYREYLKETKICQGNSRLTDGPFHFSSCGLLLHLFPKQDTNYMIWICSERPTGWWGCWTYLSKSIATTRWMTWRSWVLCQRRKYMLKIAFVKVHKNICSTNVWKLQQKSHSTYVLLTIGITERRTESRKWSV